MLLLSGRGRARGGQLRCAPSPVPGVFASFAPLRSATDEQYKVTTLLGSVLRIITSYTLQTADGMFQANPVLVYK